MDTMISLSFKERDAIKEQLSQGISFIDVLTQNQKSSYFQYLRILGKYMPLCDCIQSANEIDSNSNQLVKDILIKSVYPGFIFCFAYFMILFFSNSIAPMMSSFSSDTNSFILLDILKIVFSVLFFGLCIGFIAFLISRVSSRFQDFLYQYVKRLSIFQRIQSLQFSIVFNQLLKNGISTKECFEILEKMTCLKLVSKNAKEITNLLRQGKTLESIFQELSFDSIFVHFLSIGIRTGNFSSILEIYQKQARYRLLRDTKKITSGIQIVSYVSVGLLVLVVYQVMLVPLNMLNGM